MAASGIVTQRIQKLQGKRYCSQTVQYILQPMILKEDNESSLPKSVSIYTNHLNCFLKTSYYRDTSDQTRPFYSNKTYATTLTSLVIVAYDFV